MPVDLNFSLFPLINEAAKNEQSRPGTLMLEYFQGSITLSTNEGTVEIPTQLEEVLGLIDLSFLSGGLADTTDTMKLSTDGVISSDAVTVAALSEAIADGAVTVRGFLVGRTKARTVLIDSPTV